MTLRDVLVSSCKALNGSKIPYALTGGFAFGIHIMPRSTMDVDFCIGSLADVERITRALEPEFERIILHKTAMNIGILQLSRVIGINAGMEIIIDLIVPVNQVFASNILERRIEIDLDGCVIPVVSLDDLYIMKKLSSRDQDRIDCARIEEKAGGLLDRTYVDFWMDRLRSGS